MKGTLRGVKPKILHVVEAMGGGIFTYIVTLANELSEQFDVTIAYGLRSETPENFKEYFDERVKLIRVENFSRSVNLIKDMKSAREIVRIFDEEKPDIVHLHSSKAGVLGRLFLNKKAKKMFYTPHGYSFLMKDVSKVKRNIYLFLEKICGKKNCITVACGKGEWEESTKISRKATYISNGIDLQKLEQVMNESVSDSGEFMVYTVGRIGYQKNPEMFEKIAQLLPDIHFCWIGDGEMRNVLKSPNIEVTGWQESKQALLLARKGNVFILPSFWEGLPISLLEAMYMKKPCLVSNVVGNRDVVADGVNGYICETPQQYAERIMQLKDGNGIDVVEEAFCDIMEHYNEKWMCERYAELYLDNNI